jgi:hypothetical protein
MAWTLIDKAGSYTGDGAGVGGEERVVIGIVGLAALKEENEESEDDEKRECRQRQKHEKRVHIG